MSRWPISASALLAGCLLGAALAVGMVASEPAVPPPLGPEQALFEALAEWVEGDVAP